MTPISQCHNEDANHKYYLVNTCTDSSVCITDPAKFSAIISRPSGGDINVQATNFEN